MVTGWIVFASRGGEYAHVEVGLIRPDGAEERYLHFDVPGQVSWQASPVFSDGERMILHSVEDEKTWEHTSVSHLWVYNMRTCALTEIATRERPADFMPPAALLPDQERIIINPIIRGKQCVMTMNLDGSDQEFVTRPEDGFTYCIAPSPDWTRLAFHVAEAPNYHVVVTNLDGSGRTVVARHTDHLYFGPQWSSDGEWLLFQDCHSPTDPEHFRADLCIARPDGSEMRLVTEGQSHWFGAAYGTPESRASARTRASDRGQGRRGDTIRTPRTTTISTATTSRNRHGEAVRSVSSSPSRETSVPSLRSSSGYGTSAPCGRGTDRRSRSAALRSDSLPGSG